MWFPKKYGHLDKNLDKIKSGNNGFSQNIFFDAVIGKILERKHS